MKRTGLNQRFFALVIGAESDMFVRNCLRMLEMFGIESMYCTDVYSALAKILRAKEWDIIVISRSSTFNTDHGRFFNIASKYNCICICLEDTGSAKRYMQSLAAISTEALVVNQPDEIEAIISSVIKGGIAFKPGAGEKVKSSSFIEEDFLTTTAEINALLGRND